MLYKKVNWDGQMFQRLRRGKSLDGLGLPIVDGRRLIENLKVPAPETAFETQAHGFTLALLSSNNHVKRRHWKDIHFKGCELPNVGFFDAEIQNCIFEKCNCNEIGFWSTKISDVTFLRCILRDAAFGGNDIVNSIPPSCFRNVKFERCDLRGAANSCEIYERCEFINCNLGTMDFGGAVFRQCKFVGKLEATFRHRNPLFPKAEPNLMLDLDFTQADVTYSQFLGISVDPKWFGSNPDLIFLRNGPQDWSDWSKTLVKPELPGLHIFIEHHMKCGTPAVISRRFLLSCGFSESEIDMLGKNLPA